MRAAAAANPDKRLSLFFQDEARVGQKGRLCRRWWRRGERAPGRRDGRFGWTHIFAAVEPASGRSFALVLPEATTPAMNLFLAELGATLADDEHAVVVLDRAGWHGPRRSPCPTTSRSCACRPTARGSTPWSACGSTCASAS